MRRFFRLAGFAFTLSVAVVTDVIAQTTQLVFTAAIPEPTSSDAIERLTPVIEERGLALWAGVSSEFGVGAAVSHSRWTLRSTTSLIALPIDSHTRPTFQQVEVVGRLLSFGSTLLAGGGGVRQEWDGTQLLIGRVLAGSEVARGRLQGSLVIERTLSSPREHDAADLITTVGWSRRAGRRVSVGIEAIGQDLEGLWNPAEADGGAKLLLGPSFHAESSNGTWMASLTAGPVLHTLSSAWPSDASAAIRRSGGHDFGIFASGSWMPSLRHQ
jgi:hypothetical protein